MLNYAMVREHFVIKHDTLYRTRADGTVSPVTDLLSGKLVARLHGQILKGPEIAWALVYGSVPAFPVALLSLDPTDMREENLVPIRDTRIRFRTVESHRGFSHRLNAGLYFRTRDECFADWIVYARRYYAPDVIYALQHERLRDQHLPVPKYSRPIKKPTYAGRAKTERPPRPQPIAGRLWYWHAAQWVSVPPACHPADDYICRCEAVLKGATGFVFNQETQMVDPVYPTV
jgi:hypothetical protein